MECFYEHVATKLVALFLLVIGGTLFVTFRMAISALNKRSTRSVISAIRKDPYKAVDFSASLDIPYSKKENFPLDHFEKLKDYIQSVASIGSYNILYCTHFDSYHLLVFTEVSFIDLDINMTGGTSDTRKKAYHNFVLKFEYENNKLVVLSNIYSDITEKFQKESFLSVIFKGT